jgi:hypothetical protein
MFFVILFLWFAFDWWYLSRFQLSTLQSLKKSGSPQADTVSSTVSFLFDSADQ